MDRVRIIGDRSGRIWPLVLRTVEESRKAGRRMILYVPEQYTLQAERDLITGLGLPGLLDIQVVSPRKLRMQVLEKAGTGARSPLNEIGRAMAVHRVMTEKAGELAFYRNMTNLPGAVKRVGSALDELRESEMTREEMENCAESAPTGAERAKLKDLNLIRDGYDTLITEQFDDERTVWTDTVLRLGRSGLWDGADLAVYGFDSIRPDLRELLVKACGRVNSASVFLTMDSESAPDGQIFLQQRRSAGRLASALEENGFRAVTVWPGAERKNCAEPLLWLDRYLFARDTKPWRAGTGGALEMYAGSTPWDEAEHIAFTLRRWREEGIPWNRMAVALPGESALGSMLSANLRINGIPFSFQQTERAADHPVCRMLLAALSCLSEGWQTDDVTAVARSGYSVLTEEEGLALEDYARARGIDDSRWQKPFTSGEEAEEAERIRLKLIAPIEKLHTGLLGAEDAAASAEAVADFLETEGVWVRLQEQEDILLEREMYREAVINRQIRQLVPDLLSQLRLLLGNRRALIKDLKHMLSSALNSAELASLPEHGSGVTIGIVGHLLAGETDALALPQAQDGILTVPENSWLSDPERRRLEESTGREIGISRERGCLIRKYDYYRTLTLPRKKLLVSWSLRGEDGGALQPDGLTVRLKELFPDVKVRGGAAGGASAGPVTPQAAMDGIGPLMGDMKGSPAGPTDISPDWKDALVRLLYSEQYGETARQMVTGLLPREGRRQLQSGTARQLFITDRLSVSRLEEFASCPYRHFIDHGLRPVRKEEYDFADNDAGSFFHEALDRFMKQACAEKDWPGLTQERVDGIMDGILEELTEEWADSPLGGDALGQWQGEEYIRRVRHAAGVLTRFAANSDFRTIATEQGFGEGEALPPVMLTLKDGSRAAIRGRIDRIDTYENGEGVWLRVVDNKSREKKPDPARMATGEQLQLMIYLKAAADSMPRARLAGALFFPVQDKEVETPEDDPGRIESERLAASRMKGLVTAREDVLRAMDRDLSPYSVDRVLNKDGSVSKSANWAVEEETLRGLTQAAAEKAGELCSRIRDGEIDAVPAGDRNTSACRYCEYQAICRSGPEQARSREPIKDYRGIAAGKNTLREEEK